VIGWGGEWASQVAGATSGAAPLIIDGVLQRCRRNPRDELAALRRGRQIWPWLLIASIFGFAVLLPPEARDAALALLDETAAARRAYGLSATKASLI
jgi:hypothetical protein